MFGLGCLPMNVYLFFFGENCDLLFLRGICQYKSFMRVLTYQIMPVKQSEVNSSICVETTADLQLNGAVGGREETERGLVIPRSLELIKLSIAAVLLLL